MFRAFICIQKVASLYTNNSTAKQESTSYIPTSQKGQQLHHVTGCFRKPAQAYTCLTISVLNESSTRFCHTLFLAFCIHSLNEDLNAFAALALGNSTYGFAVLLEPRLVFTRIDRLLFDMNIKLYTREMQLRGSLNRVSHPEPRT